MPPLLRLEKTFPTTSRHEGNEKTLETFSFSVLIATEKERKREKSSKEERIKITKEARTSRPRSLDRDIADTTRTSKEKKSWKRLRVDLNRHNCQNLDPLLPLDTTGVKRAKKTRSDRRTRLDDRSQGDEFLFELKSNRDAVVVQRNKRK